MKIRDVVRGVSTTIAAIGRTGSSAGPPEEIVRIKPYSTSGLAALERLYLLGKDILSRDIPGDFVECGVWNGGSAAALACAFRGAGRRLWLYDSFAGLPPPTGIDGPAAVNYSGACVGSEGTVKEALCVAQFPLDSCIIRKGWFSDTFRRDLPDQVALLHVDADWYESVKLVLQTFYDKVSEGGIIILDDFGHWEGCREAFYDFAMERQVKPLLERFGHTQAYWVKGRSHNRDLPASLGQALR